MKTTDDPETFSALDMWVVYDHPSDYPDAFVARRHLAFGGSPDGTPTRDVIIAADLDAVRTALALRGLVQLARMPEDHPVIVEVWL